jgi:hypothetical protein
MNEIQFEGFEQQKPKQEKDLPLRPLPQPIPTEAKKTWSPQVGKEEVKDTSTQQTLINMVNIALPIVGLTIVLGTIVGIIVFVIQFYSN